MANEELERDLELALARVAELEEVLRRIDEYEMPDGEDIIGGLNVVQAWAHLALDAKGDGDE